MSYRRAEHILPMEVIKLIQDYVDGECIYIPRKANARRNWGEGTQIRKELNERDVNIYTDYQTGFNTNALAEKYYLSEKSIQRIIYKMKNN